MRVEAEVEAPAPLSEVWAWWTDYGTVGTSTKIGHGGVTTERRIVEASPTRVVIEEEAPLPLVRDATRAQRTVEIDAAAHTLVERGEQPVPFEARWTFEQMADGERTRIRRVMDVHHKAADMLARAAVPVARAAMERDMRAHIKDFERDRATGVKR